MIEVFDLLRRTVADRPLWICLGLILISIAVRRLFPRQVDAARQQTCARAVAMLAILYYVGLAAWYLAIPQQSDDAEPTMTCVAWLFGIGEPVYHALFSAERYSHMYGPMAFIVPGAALSVLGPSMLVAKGVGVVAALCALLLTWLAVRSAAAGVWLTTVACGLCVLEFLVFRNMTFWSRPEPLQLAAVAAGLFAAAVLPRAAAAVVVSVAMGVLWNLKITGPLYSLPIFALLYARVGVGPLIASSAGAAIVAVLPFVVFERVSFSDYLLWVRVSSRNGLRVAALKENLEWAIFLLLPVLARLTVRTPLPPPMRFTVPALVIGICGVIVAASKPGAGTYHMLPFLPTLAYVYAATMTQDAERARRIWLTPFMVTLVFVALLQQQYFFRITLDSSVAESYADAREYLRRHPGERVALGYTSAERMTFARTLTVFSTGRYLLDVPAIQEHQLSGIQVPPATIDAIRACDATTWLIPLDGEPFDNRNAYPSTGHARIFPPEFIAAFHAAYRKEERTRFYDVWRCRAGQS